jgi:hypothetical protein
MVPRRHREVVRVCVVDRLSAIDPNNPAAREARQNIARGLSEENDRSYVSPMVIRVPEGASG